MKFIDGKVGTAHPTINTQLYLHVLENGTSWLSKSRVGMYIIVNVFISVGLVQQ